MRAVIYTRVSTDEQADGYSLDAQVGACKQYASTHGWEIEDVCADEGLSGRLPPTQRPGLAAALAAIRERRAHVLIVHKLDRLARSVRLTNEIMDELQQRQVAFVAVADQIDLTTPFGWAAFQMQAVWSELYIKNLSMETAKGHREKARQGGWVGPVPFGYERDGKTLRPSADAPIVVEMFERYTSGTESYTSIADSLNAAGHRMYDWQTGQRGLFGRESVRTILRNRAYCGYVSSGGQSFPGNHPQLVDESLWQRAQSLRGLRTRPSGTPGDADILAQLVYCAACGSTMYRNASGRASSRVTYYRCSGPRRSGAGHCACAAPMAATRPIEQTIRALVAQLRVSPDLRDALLAEASAYAQQAPQTPPDAKARERALRQLKEQFLDERISASDYDRQRTALLAVPLAAPSAMPDLDLMLSLLADIPALFAAATPSEARALIRPIISHVWVEQRSIAAITPTAAAMPLLLGIWEVDTGCGNGCPMGISIRSPHPIALWTPTRTPLAAA